MNKTLTVLMLGRITLLLLASVAGAALEAATPSWKPYATPGPYPVGVMTVLFTDPSRQDPVTGEARQLVTEIWYPAVDSARRKMPSLYTDFLPGGVTPEVEKIVQKTYRENSTTLNERYLNAGVRNVEVRRGKFPVVFFSHGNGGTRHQNTFMSDHLASHGYVVVSPDHTGNSSITILPNRVVPYQSSVRNASGADRPKDLSFLLDQMHAWNRGMDGRFKGKLDLSRPVASGMSFGGMTSVNVVDRDPRFKAIIALSGAAFNRTNTSVPALWMLGEEDTTIGPIGNTLIRAHHKGHTGPSYLLEVVDGGHYTFTDMFKISPNFGDGIGMGKRRSNNEPFPYTSMEDSFRMINTYSLAFLEAYVRDNSKARRFLSSPTPWPALMKLDVRNLRP